MIAHKHPDGPELNGIAAEGFDPQTYALTSHFSGQPPLSPV